jgi:SAM-dependent methyltransferase
MKHRFIIRWFDVFSEPFYLLRRPLEQKVAALATSLQGRVLDFGCGSKPYLQYFGHADQYIGLDIAVSGHSHQNELIDVFYDGKTIPFENNSMDAVFSSEVFEHVFNLEEILPEICRVMKPGAKMLFTCPFAWPEHEVPYDFARYSSFGIKALLERHGFEVVEQHKTGHFFQVAMQYLILYIFYWLPKRPIAIYYILHQLLVLPPMLLTLLVSVLLPERMKRKDLYFNNVLLIKKK